MQGIDAIRRVNPTLAKNICGRGGFIISDDVPALIEINRLMPVLVRCGNGRFTCPVQDLKHFMGIIEKHANMVQAHTGETLNVGTDYIRDVSLPA